MSAGVNPMDGESQTLAVIQEGLSVPQAESSDFEAAFGEKLSQALDLDTWMLGEDIMSAYGRLEHEIAEALAKEDEYRQKIREVVFSRIRNAPGAPDNAGVYQASRSDLERVHTGLLFNGGVEACDGISIVHDTVPLNITQIGVSLVSYNGQQGSWAHRLFRRDLRARVSDPVQEVLNVLEQREKRESQGFDGGSLSELARRGIMAYAERAILAEKSEALWRMGHGSPAPYELLTGRWSSQRKHIEISLNLIRWYVLEHKRFVFVPSAPRKRHLLTIGNALNPLEFAILQTLKPDIQHMIDTGHYRDDSGVRPAMQEFCNRVAPYIVVGLYRVWEGSPPYLFYAHIDHAEMAAHIAMADSVLQEHRGFPMLIDLADTVCRTTFGLDSFIPSVQTAYTDAGHPFRYLSERETRRR
jgi:hypothetical protein